MNILEILNNAALKIQFLLSAYWMLIEWNIVVPLFQIKTDTSFISLIETLRYPFSSSIAFHHLNLSPFTNQLSFYNKAGLLVTLSYCNLSQVRHMYSPPNTAPRLTVSPNTAAKSQAQTCFFGLYMTPFTARFSKTAVFCQSRKWRYGGDVPGILHFLFRY